jgi:hypothetical protein
MGYFTWPIQGGGIEGPVSSTNNAVALWDGTTASALKNSDILLDGLTVRPLVSGGLSLGNSTFYWANLYATSAVVESLYFDASLSRRIISGGLNTLTTHANRFNFYSLSGAYYSEIILDVSGLHFSQTNLGHRYNSENNTTAPARLVFADVNGLPNGPRLSQATLVAGTVTVSNATVTANSKIFLSYEGTPVNPGSLSTTKVAGTSFTINSTSVTDASTVSWFIVENG